MSRWQQFEKYCIRCTPILEAISRNGLGIDPVAQKAFFDTLTKERDAIYDTIQSKVPLHVFNVKSWKRSPKLIDPGGMATITIGHHDDEKLTAKVKLVAYPEGGYWARLPFNPRAWQQVQELATALGAKLPRKQDGDGDDDTSTDDKALKRVAKKFPVFEDIRQYRKRDKLINSYNWTLQSKVYIDTLYMEVPVEGQEKVVGLVESQGKTPSKKTNEREDAESKVSGCQVQNKQEVEGEKSRTVSGNLSSVQREVKGKRVLQKVREETVAKVEERPKQEVRSSLQTPPSHSLYVRGDWVGDAPKGKILSSVQSAFEQATLERQALHPSQGLGQIKQRRSELGGGVCFVPQQIPQNLVEYGSILLPFETESTSYRVSPQFGFHSSTWRKTCRAPNIMTIPKRSDLAKAFRKMIVPWPGNVLIEGDSAAIEAVIVGYLAGSPRYIRLARAGVHGWLTSALHGTPISLDISDAALTAACQMAKKEWPDDYEKCKRVVHLSNYCGTPRRIAEEYPDEFRTEGEAAKLQGFYFESDAGKDVKAWQKQTVEVAHANKGLENHFGLRHRFYSLYSYDNRRKIYVLGDDAKRAVAFVPQSDASFVQSDILLRLVERDERFLQWIVAIIHDSCVLDLPERDAAYAAGVLYQEMTRPLEQLGNLWIGAAIATGSNLAEMTTWRPSCE